MFGIDMEVQGEAKVKKCKPRKTKVGKGISPGAKDKFKQDKTKSKGVKNKVLEVDSMKQ